MPTLTRPTFRPGLPTVVGSWCATALIALIVATHTRNNLVNRHNESSLEFHANGMIAPPMFTDPLSLLVGAAQLVVLAGALLLAARRTGWWWTVAPAAGITAATLSFLFALTPNLPRIPQGYELYLTSRMHGLWPLVVLWVAASLPAATHQWRRQPATPPLPAALALSRSLSRLAGPSSGTCGSEAPKCSPRRY